MRPYRSLHQGNLVDMVFEQLKKDIVSGRLKAGERFPPQETLAGQFGVSRPVIREAQNKLASLGLVKSRQGSGTFVSRPQASEVMGPMLSLVELDERSTAELMETRFHLEGVIARLAAQRATAAQSTGLLDLVNQMQKATLAGDLPGFNLADFNFHLELARLSGNRVMASILETIRGMTVSFLQSFSKTEGAQARAIQFHRNIAVAVAAGRADKAEQEMAFHLDDIVRNIRKHFRFDLPLPQEAAEGRAKKGDENQ